MTTGEAKEPRNKIIHLLAEYASAPTEFNIEKVADEIIALVLRHREIGEVVVKPTLDDSEFMSKLEDCKAKLIEIAKEV